MAASVADDMSVVVTEGRRTGGSYSDWMSNLPSHLHNIPLNRLAIPGSHDSGSYELRTDWDVSPGTDSKIKNLCSIPIIGAAAKDIIHKWGKCQNLTIPEQLNAGIRYFDFRVAYHSQSEEFHFIHMLYGPQVTDCMQEMVTFLSEHPNEVVLLDFNHFYSMELEQHVQLITLLISLFEGRLCPVSSADKTSLATLWQNNMQVIIFYHNDAVNEFSDLWPARAITSPWANTMDADQCLEYQIQAANSKRCRERFHVCQAVLTPHTKIIIQHVMGSVYNDCAKKINGKLQEWTQSDRLKGQQGMIYIVDFVEEGNFVTTVVSLNNSVRDDEHQVEEVRCGLEAV